MMHFISAHALEVVRAIGYRAALEAGQLRLIIADEDGYDAVLTDDELAELSAGLEDDDNPTAIWQPDLRPWDPPAGYRAPPPSWNQ